MLWYALQVNPQCEQRVEAALSPQIEAFYPWRESRGHIGNHERILRKPWFPGYVFARFGGDSRSRILAVRHVCRVVGDEPIRDHEIESVRALHLLKYPVMEHPPVKIGERVRLTGGILAGIEGTLIRFAGKGALLVVTIEALNKSVAASIEPEWIEKVKAA